MRNVSFQISDFLVYVAETPTKETLILDYQDLVLTPLLPL